MSSKDFTAITFKGFHMKSMTRLPSIKRSDFNKVFGVPSKLTDEYLTFMITTKKVNDIRLFLKLRVGDFI